MSASTSSLPQGGAPVTANNVKRCKVHHQLVVYSLVSNVFLHYALYGLYRMPEVIDIGINNHYFTQHWCPASTFDCLGCY